MQKKSYILLLFFLSAFYAFGQDSAQAEKKRPKIGLVLSGGGAKGLAHIGFLKVMEEAGLKPDYITGTSAGSFVGALYSMGYTPDQMKKIATSVDWTTIMGNKVPLNRVAIEEKDYYSRYIFDIDIEGTNFSLPGGLITGHQLQQFIAELTFPYHSVTDFTQLPIPFKCVATDIETGEIIVMDSGNIAEAIRASMSIPTVFAPVEVDGRLLVDGGLVRNFPVQEVIDMGADVVIGVYTGYQLKDKENLKSLFSILTQSAFLMGMNDAYIQIPKCDIYIEPELGDLTSSDFVRADSIIARGERTARKYLEQLKLMSDTAGSSIEMHQMHLYDNKLDTFQLKAVDVNGTERIPEEYIKGKLHLEEGKKVTHQYIINRIEVLYGTQYFEKVSYNIEETDTGTVLLIDVIEVPPAKLRFALHYDTDTRSALTINFTSRNAIVPSSRIIAEVEIADLPKGELSYFQYTGKEQELAIVLNAKATFENEIIASNISSQEATYSLGTVSVSGGFQTTSSVNWTLGAFISKEWNTLKPKVNNDTILSSVSDQNYFASFFFKLNTMNTQFFPSKGIKLSLEGRYHFNIEQAVRTHAESKAMEAELNDSLKYDEDYLGVRADLDLAIPLRKNLSLVGGSFIGFYPTTNPLLTDAYFIGGISPKNFNSLSFWGTEVNTFYSSNAFIVNGGLQWTLYRKLIIEGRFNYINVSEPFSYIDEQLTGTISGDYSSIYSSSQLETSGRSFKSTYGGGIRVSYLTFFGPISVALSRWEFSKTYEPYLSIGFRL
ncbi:MAG: hypothetical protein CL843_18180 [Crocinitomicaceae bacterium]|nr:hypothetical protein [Crocinitomicaceae bacterium]